MRSPPTRRRPPRRGPPARADDDEVVERKLFLRLEADSRGDLGRVGADERLGVRQQHDGQPVGAKRGLREQPACGLLVDLEPAVGDLVVREQVAHALRLRGEVVPDDAHCVAVGLCAGCDGLDRGPPVFEQVVEHGVETLLGRVPRLHQVVVEADLIDRAHRRLGVRVRGKEHALRIGREGLGLRQQLDSRHPGHALVGDDQRHRIAPRGELSQDLQRVLEPAATTVKSPA